ncbi:hypothetical protein KI809_11440 [Geobacter pelophilus]|uniref:Restriction endonuclease subunit S n=1 Tax=Geoanaerobacter pelophilus TaxID=60036 RepID=A0AAW4LA43_9BACT|nr:hypothetical protein [Geoanaerobacter pelophilus]MBT0664914.1 hypothetical protein [Geoanaerobacter pelophilus]
MHVSRAPAKRLLTKRIDPDYYAPQHLADEERLEGIGVITLGSVGKLFAGPFGSELPNSVFVEKGIPLFRVGNVGSMEVDGNNMAQIPLSLHQELSASEVLPGDLLIVKASVGEKICIIPETMERANVTQHIIGLHPNGSVDIHYVAAALFSEYGRRQQERRALGAIIQYLGVNDARTVLLPKLHSDAQEYIGNKVRKAEKLGAVARKTVANIELFHLALIPSFDFKKKKKNNRVSSLRLVERLDAEHYPAEVKDFFDGIVKCQRRTLGYCCTDIFTGSTLSESEYHSVYQTTVANLDTSFLRPPYRNVVSSKSLQKKIQNHDLLICAAAHNASYIGKDITYAVVEGTIIPSTEVIVIRPDHSKVPSSYVRTFLKTKIGFLSLQATVRGITAHAYPADISDVEIPMPVFDSKEEMHRWFKSDEEMVVAGHSFDAGLLLTTAARFLVEALIDLKITEADLIAALKDPTKDRELLSRLTPKGIDVPGEPPLFPDLDALFELLAEKETEVA